MFVNGFSTILENGFHESSTVLLSTLCSNPFLFNNSLFLCYGTVHRLKSCFLRSPIEADFLVAYATVPGYVSWRNSARGSWFIQSICEIFAKFAKSADVLDMLTMVPLF